jgi:hypothetical protein
MASDGEENLSSEEQLSESDDPHSIVIPPQAEISRVTQCKGNLAVQVNHSGLARDSPKNI